MPKRPPLPKVNPVVSRALLGVALGTVGCAKHRQVRIGQPDDYYLRIGPPPPPELPPSFEGTVHEPEGEPLADTSIKVLIDGEEAMVTTDAEGHFVVDGLSPDARLEIHVEGFEPFWPDRYYDAGEVFVLTPNATPEDAPPADAPPADAPPADAPPADAPSS